MRARNIKPGLFSNEILGTADPLLSLLFIGLWCLADKEGLLEDRPLRIKAQVFPYRDMDSRVINGYLTDLSRLGFIRRYEVGELKMIEVLKFKQHQSPHHTEKASVLPPYPTDNEAVSDLTVSSPLIHRETTVSSRSDSLIPDSLIADSLIPEPSLPSVDMVADRAPRLQANADAPRKPLGKVAKSPKGKTRVPADFEPAQSNLEWWSRQDAPAGIDPVEETEKFRDHHVAKGTVFADHQAAWRTWMRNAIKFSRNSPPQPKEQQKVKGYDPTKDMLSPLYVKPKPKLNLDDMIFKVLNNYENCVFYAGWTFRDCWNSMNKRFQDRTGWTAEQIEAYANTDEYRQAEKRARNWNDSPNAKRQASVSEPLPLPVPPGQESFGTASAER